MPKAAGSAPPPGPKITIAIPASLGTERALEELRTILADEYGRKPKRYQVVHDAIMQALQAAKKKNRG